MLRFSLITPLACLALPLAVLAVDDKPTGSPDSAGGLQPFDRKAEPGIAPASQEGTQVLKQLGLPAGMKADLWAAEPELANPVALSVDEKGRVFVAETHQLGSSVLDIRNYMFMLEDDLACRTVEDRIAMCKKHFGEKFADLEKEEDFIRLMEDRDHDGKADFASLYARGFNHAEDGIPAGVLARQGTVWATIIPNLWRFDGTNDKGEAVTKKSLSYGYGVRFGYTGHDMHGLILGPDGRLYFSIGDRAANVQLPDGRRIENVDSGAVFRCEQDGSKLEIIHWGLRNPQELAFDDHGNLFTGDNDFDYGDTERLVYVVEGGDSGWRVGYQHPPMGKERVPWKSEQIWMSFKSSQEKYNGVPNPKVNEDLGVRPAAYLPPVSNIGDGPSGLLFDTGTGISPQFRQHFLLCHSKGSYAKSEIRAFTLKEDGASFELGETKPFLQFIHSPDLDLAPDGSVYVLDWAETMSKTAKGRIFRVYDPSVLADPLTLETKKYLEEGMHRRSLSELVKLLAHADRRVRMEAEFALAWAGPGGIGSLERAAADRALSPDARLARLGRLHAIWGLGILGRKNSEVCRSLPALLKDADSEVRAQVAKVLGDVRYGDAAGALTIRLQDDTPRVQYFAAQALGKLKAKQAVTGIIELIKQNNNKDAYLRHACVMALYGICVKREGFQPSSKQLAESAFDADMMGILNTGIKSSNEPGVGLAMTLVARRLHEEIGTLMVAGIYNDSFDKDAHKAVRLETARAITEDRAWDRLNLFEQAQHGVGMYEPIIDTLTTRTLYSWFLLRNRDGIEETGEAAQSKRAGWLASVATYKADRPEANQNRLDALTYLGEWATPQTRNRFTGLSFTFPWKPRPPDGATNALKEDWDGIMHPQQASEVRVAAIAAVRKLKADSFAPKMAAIVKDNTQPAELRLAALEALGDWQNVAALNEAITAAQESGDASLRRATLQLLPKVDAERAVTVLESTLNGDDTAAKREAMVVLGTLPAGRADALIAEQVDKLIAGKVKPTGMLEVIETAKRRENGEVKAKLQQYLQSLPQTRSAAAFPYLLAGGDTSAGKKIFFEHTAAQCMRCHKVGNKGSEVGPALDGVSTKHPREYLLEAVLFPNNNIAPGFEMTMVTTKDGKSYGGMVRKETDTEIQLSAPVPNAPVDTVKKADIQTRSPGISAMPEIMQQVLTQRELRDLVAFLASLK
ncbi:HEAT repeat domain-containing protein [Roseimicrobium sp. ORNL1]|uniref:DUF7133 domain-containing protein n=1 Tax=Roseimicrobium sp. ORNL1 TaxID=2711231 RepID=UPI0013E171CF|nr:HEAT repeat domain-containing protein [Roseimicrobium sp. ORNL1]QIF02133.1 c-type cytochrome [Roseimicrobium sp. ORNL1]